MKKVFAVLLSAMLVSAAAVTASAAPADASAPAAATDEVASATDAASTIGAEKKVQSVPSPSVVDTSSNRMNSGSGDGANGGKSGNNTSPKTGAPIAEGVLLAAAALAFAGVAVSSKKKS